MRSLTLGGLGKELTMGFYLQLEKLQQYVVYPVECHLIVKREPFHL